MAARGRRLPRAAALALLQTACAWRARPAAHASRSRLGQPTLSSAASPTLFVANIPWKASAQRVCEALAPPRGAGVELWLAPDRVDASKHAGWGRATFSDEEAARAAAANGVTLMGRSMSLTRHNPRNAKRNAKRPVRRTAPRVPSRSRTLHLLSTASDGATIAALLGTLGPLRSPRECTTAIAAWARAKDWRRACDVLVEMRPGGLHDGLRPTRINFNAAMAACARGGAWRRAAQLLEGMGEAGLTPDAISYHTLLDAMTRGAAEREGTRGAAADARPAARRSVHLLQRMMRAGELQPSATAFTNVMAACTRARYWGAALATFERLRRTAPEAVDVAASNAALAACAGQRAGQRARDLLASMRERGLEPDLASYDSCMEATAACGELSAGFDLLDAVYDAGLGACSYPLHRNLLEACTRAGAFARADRVQEAIDRLGLRSVAPAAHARAHQSGGGTLVYGNGGLPKALGAASRALCDRAAADAGYAPQLHALPFSFRRNSTAAQQRNSLKHHAEKKALADLLARGEDRLEIGVNFRVCADCHAFFKAASNLVDGRPIVVSEPTRAAAARLNAHRPHTPAPSRVAPRRVTLPYLTEAQPTY